MRSRVKKNAELYSQIASDTESKVESNDLSHFANRLNAIDKQFGKMDVTTETNTPNHARSIEDTYEQSKIPPVLPFDKVNVNDLKVAIEDEPKASEPYVEPSFKEHDEFDTFESTYLNDFLAEVKEYNVKKGYREIDNTSTNIMRDLNLDIQENKSRVISDTDDQGPYIPEGIDDLLTSIDPLINDLTPVRFEKMEDLDIGAMQDDGQTKHFTAVDHLQRFDQDDAHLEETIALEVQRMVEDDYEGEPYGNEDLEVDLASEEDDIIMAESLGAIPGEIEAVEYEDDSQNKTMSSIPIEDIEVEEDRVMDSKIARQIMEQTQTLQIKVIDQEKNIEEMTDTMVKTNRLLNVTLSLLMLAIFVVVMLIISSIWR